MTEPDPKYKDLPIVKGAVVFVECSPSTSDEMLKLIEKELDALGIHTIAVRSCNVPEIGEHKDDKQ